MQTQKGIVQLNRLVPGFLDSLMKTINLGPKKLQKETLCTLVL
jgi:hypothetical protein